MSRLSFIVLIFTLYIGLVAFASGHLTPINDGGFIEDFFGSDSSQIIPQDERDRADLMIKANHAVPRYTFFTSNFSLKRAPSEFCLPNSSVELSSESNQTYDLDSCQWYDYMESLLLISGIAFIVAIIIFPFLFCGLTLGRCCCCGKYKPTPEVCCGDNEDFDAATMGYEASVIVLFVLSIVCCVIIAGGAGVGLWGSITMTENVNHMANFTNRTAQTFADIIDSVVSIFRGLGEIQNISEAVDPETLDDAEYVSSQVRYYANGVAEYSNLIDFPRQMFMYVTLALPLILMVLVVLSRFCCCWWLSWGMSFLGFILTALSLITFGFLYPMSSGIADICVFLDHALENPDSDNFINSIFSCGNDSVLSSFSNMSASVFETAANVTCDMYSLLENITAPCDKNGDNEIWLLDENERCNVIGFEGSDNCTVDTFSEMSKNASMYDWRIGCFCETLPDTYVFHLQGECGVIHSLYDYDESLCPANDSLGRPCRPFYCHNDTDAVKVSMSYCAENCSDDQLAGNSSSILAFTKVASDIFDLYTSTIKPYLNCESVVGITNHAKDFICVNMMNAVTPMFIGEIIASFGSFIGTFVALLSTKRFNKKYRRKYALLKESEVEMHSR